VALDQGQVDEVPGRLQEALACFRGQGDAWGIAWTLFQAGHVARIEGNYRRAITAYEESLAQVRLVNGRAHEEILLGLGRALQASGDAAGAMRLYRESLTCFQATGMPHSSGVALTIIASIVGSDGQRPDRAARVVQILGAAAALWEASGTALPPIERASYDGALAAARKHLGAANWNAAWNAGRAMPLEEAIAYALENDPTAARSSGPPAEAPGATPWPRLAAGLTAREVEVLQLVAQGHTTAAVAAHLHLSPLTVNVHLRAIYRKLHVTSRTAAARVAHELQLV
jgi:DNA-binding CsgD family transcriptional regulator